MKFFAALLGMVRAVGISPGKRHVGFRTLGAMGLKFDSRGAQP